MDENKLSLKLNFRHCGSLCCPFNWCHRSEIWHNYTGCYREGLIHWMTKKYSKIKSHLFQFYQFSLNVTRMRKSTSHPAVINVLLDSGRFLSLIWFVIFQLMKDLIDLGLKYHMNSQTWKLKKQRFVLLGSFHQEKKGSLQLKWDKTLRLELAWHLILTQNQLNIETVSHRLWLSLPRPMILL